MADSTSGLFMLLMAILGGGILGGLFFAGLWWTVQIGLKSAYTGVWFFTSSLLRIGLAVVGIYLITYGEWPRLVACLSGFIAARFIIVWLAPQHSSLINNSISKQSSGKGDRDAT